MKYTQSLLTIMSLFIVVHCVSAQNPDILWQKTLTKDTIPIASIAIAEGKYVAVLKGDEIIILDYKTGDSIKVFPKPKDMLRNDIFFGKNGERLLLLTQSGFLRIWDVFSGHKLNDVNMNATRLKGSLKSFSGVDFQIDYSLDGKYIAVLTSYNFYEGPDHGSSRELYVFNTIDSVYSTPFSILKLGESHNISKNKGKTESLLSKSIDLNFSPSGNYLLNNITNFFAFHHAGGEFSYSSSEDAYISSFSPSLKSYHFSGHLPYYMISSGDDFLLSGNNLMEIPPVHVFRTISKPGFVFLPDDNHMLAFNAAGGVAAISNIEKDTWEKVYQGDSLTENIIQTNAARTAFATASNNRITLWKVPDTLQAAALTADFNMSKDSIPIFDSITFANKTFPMKRGAYFEWNFGDGTITNEIYPVHKFTKSGTFTVILSVRDTLRRTSVISKNVVVSFPSPKAVFTTPKDTVFVGDMVSFTNTSTPIRNGTYFNWNFGDGASSTEFNPKHQFFQTGTFTVKLSIHDTLVRKDNTTKTIVVIDQIVPSGAQWVNHFHYQQINSIAFSHDGHSVISGSDDGFSRVWTTYSATQLYLKNFGQPVYSVTFTKDNKSCIVGSYRITDNSPIYKKGSIAKLINNTDIWSFSGDYLESKIYWDVQSANSSLSYQYLTKSSLCSSVSDDNNWYLLGSRFYSVFSPFSFDSNPKIDSFNYGNIYLYNVSTGQSKYFDPYHSSLAPKGDLTYLLYPVYSVLVSPDSRFYLYSQGSRVFIRDIITDSVCFIIPKFTPIMHFSPDKHNLLTTSGYWDIYKNKLIKAVELPSIFEFHPDGIHVFTLRPDSSIGIYNLNSNSYEYLYPKQPTIFTALAVAPDGKHIATGDKNGYLTVWKVPDSFSTDSSEDPKTDFQVSFKVIPNPSYGETTLSYTLSEPSPVQIRITDVLGREVSSWSLNESEGLHSLLWNGSSVGAGMYYCTFSAQGIIRTLPFVVLQ